MSPSRENPHRERQEELGLEPAGLEEREYLAALAPGADEHSPKRIVIDGGSVVMFPKGSVPEADDLFDRLFEDGAADV